MEITKKYLNNMPEITQTTMLLLSGLAVLHWMQFAK
jgi:uncharacterized membrane protein SirB2